MKLHEWIKITGIQKSQLAELLGVPNKRISAFLSHRTIPRPDEMVKLYWITFGAVRPADFYDLTVVPADLQYLLKPQPRRKYVCIDDINITGERKRNSWKRSALDH
jgi:hypothetical protein